MKINDKLIKQSKVLWTNPNPNIDFPQQAVDIDLTGYDEIEIIFKVNKYDESIKNVKVPNGKMICMNANYQYGNRGYIGGRVFITQTKTFNDAVSIVKADAFSRSASNDMCIPLHIIGHKTNLFN